MNEQLVTFPATTFETTSLQPEYKFEVSEKKLANTYYLDISIKNYNISKIYLKTVPANLNEINIVIGKSPFATFTRQQIEQSLHTRKNLLDHIKCLRRYEPIDTHARSVIVPIYDVMYQTVEFVFRYSVPDSLEREDAIEMEPVYSDDYEMFIDRYGEEHEGKRCIGETPVVRGQILKNPLRIETPEIDFVLQETKNVLNYTMHMWQYMGEILEDPEREQCLVEKFQYDKVLHRIRNVFQVYANMGSFMYCYGA